MDNLLDVVSMIHFLIDSIWLFLEVHLGDTLSEQLFFYLYLIFVVGIIKGGIEFVSSLVSQLLGYILSKLIPPIMSNRMANPGIMSNGNDIGWVKRERTVR